MTTGTVKQAERQRRPQDSAGPERRRRQPLGEKRLIDRAAHEVHEEAQSEDAEHDGRHAGQVVDGDAHQPDQNALMRVLAQVQRRQDAERHGKQAHEDDHHHGAEDGRQNAALRVGLAGLTGQELPEPR